MIAQAVTTNVTHKMVIAICSEPNPWNAIFTQGAIVKLLLCNNCHDIFNLALEPKECGCGKTIGAYKSDRINAWYQGPATPLGFANASFELALLNPPEDYGWGQRFEAFVIPLKCTSFVKEG